MADQVFGAGESGLAGARNTDDDVVLTGEAREQDLEAGQQSREERGLVFGPGALDALIGVGGDHAAAGCAAKSFDCGARAVGGQVERIDGSRELREPIILGGRMRGALDLERFVDDIFAILHCRFEVRRPATKSRRIERGQFVQDDVRGPSVAHDVMSRDDEVVLIVGELHQLRADERAAREAQRRGGLGAQNLVDARVAS